MEYRVTLEELTRLADAIRIKGGTVNPLVWVDEFIDAVNNMGGRAPRGIFIGEYNDLGDLIWDNTAVIVE